MTTILNNTSFIEHYNLIRVTDCTQPMGNHDNCSSMKKGFKLLYDRLLVTCISDPRPFLTLGLSGLIQIVEQP